MDAFFKKWTQSNLTNNLKIERLTLVRRSVGFVWNGYNWRQSVMDTYGHLERASLQTDMVIEFISD